MAETRTLSYEDFAARCEAGARALEKELATIIWRDSDEWNFYFEHGGPTLLWDEEIRGFVTGAILPIGKSGWRIYTPFVLGRAEPKSYP